MLEKKIEPLCLSIFGSIQSYMSESIQSKWSEDVHHSLVSVQIVFITVCEKNNKPDVSFELDQIKFILKCQNVGDRSECILWD